MLPFDDLFAVLPELAGEIAKKVASARRTRRLMTAVILTKRARVHQPHKNRPQPELLPGISTNSNVQTQTIAKVTTTTAVTR